MLNLNLKSDQICVPVKAADMLMAFFTLIKAAYAAEQHRLPSQHHQHHQHHQLLAAGM